VAFPPTQCPPKLQFSSPSLPKFFPVYRRTLRCRALTQWVHFGLDSFGFFPRPLFLRSQHALLYEAHADLQRTAPWICFSFCSSRRTERADRGLDTLPLALLDLSSFFFLRLPTQPRSNDSAGLPPPPRSTLHLRKSSGVPLRKKVNPPLPVAVNSRFPVFYGACRAFFLCSTEG